MAVYRYQVVAVGMWRGKIKRWNTTFHTTSSTSTANLLIHMNKSCFKSAGDVVGACSGGIASISVYGPGGGSPILKTTYFDWETPGTWIPFTGEVWSTIDPATPLDASGESAVLVVGNMGGLSSSGKPVTTRKYIHAIPSRTAASYTDPDVPTAVQTALTTLWTPDWLANPAGIVPVSTSIESYYGNHQRVRGRRRTSSSVAAQSFSAGVVVGSGAPFPEPRIEFLNQQ